MFATYPFLYTEQQWNATIYYIISEKCVESVEKHFMFGPPVGHPKLGWAGLYQEEVVA